MRINLIAIGKKMPEWLNSGIHHYQKQLSSNYNFTLTSLEAQNRKTNNIDKIKTLEGNMLLEVAKGLTTLIAFDELGKQQSSRMIAKSIETWQLHGDNVALIIGGADGLSSELKQQCHYIWGALQPNHDPFYCKTISYRTTLSCPHVTNQSPLP